MLTRMLVPNPKKAFQSPAVQMVGRSALSVAIVIARSRQNGCRDAPASRADLEKLALIRRAGGGCHESCSGGFASKKVSSASTRGWGPLEAEAEAAESD